MLRENDYAWVRSIRRGRNKSSAGSRQTDHRIRTKVRKALNDLVFLAEYLDESQAAQIFTVDRVKPLASALLSRRDANIDRQLSLAEMFIAQGAALWNRPGVMDKMKLRLGGNIDLTLQQARDVLIASRLAKLKEFNRRLPRRISRNKLGAP